MLNGTINDSFASINKAGSWYVDASASEGPSHTPSSGGWYVLAFHTHSQNHLCLLAYTSNNDGAIYMGEDYIGHNINWNRIKTEKLP